jgi:prepilin-type N-terminal cleavage/methylation domain-containing protein
VRRIRRVATDERGYSLVELIAVMAILVTVVTTVTGLFVSGARAELDLNRRFEAQQAARVAADRLRREIHCAKKIELASPASITVTLPAHCPTAVGGVETTIVYDVVSVSVNRFRLRRAGMRIADHLTSANVFSWVPPSPAALGKLHLDLSVNVTPEEGWRTWRLQTDVVLRNTTRS